MHKNDKNEFNLNIETILNSNFEWHGTIDKFFEIVKLSGYPYFLWNERVFKVKDYQEGYEDTGVLINDIRNRDLTYKL